jgi:protoporphyrinogen oxidase
VNGLRRVVIIGGGLAGLASAYDLGKRGFAVTLLESSDDLGGLASAFEIDQTHLERFYHFVCHADVDLVQFAQELDVASKLHWRETRTSFFYNDHLYAFGSPFDLLSFAPVPPVQRLRFGLNILQSRYRREWQALDAVSARDWLMATVGREAYTVIWEPLLRVKFGEYHDQISAAWIWHRIWRVASSRQRIWAGESMGYLERGSTTLVEAVLHKIGEYPNVQVRCGTRVSRIVMVGDHARGVRLQDGESIPCDFVISTVPLPILVQMAPDLPAEYREQVGLIQYIGVVCMMLKLRQPLTTSFWINTNDPRIPFNGFIEYTNLNPRPDIHGSRIVYIPFYLPVTAERFRRRDEDLFTEYTTALRHIVPSFDPSWVEEYRVFREKYAQAICHVNFLRQVPGHATPVRNLFITDSVQFYPEDRTISAAIRLGRHVAQMVKDAHD